MSERVRLAQELLGTDFLDKVSLEPVWLPSGLLAAASNAKDGIALKYQECKDAMLADRVWRLFVYKGTEELGSIALDTPQSWTLFGRDERVCGVKLDHPSISSQHAVIQFRRKESRNEFGDVETSVEPYLMDLESRHGTKVNGTEIPEARYYQLLSKDLIQFGQSSREYMLMADDAE